MYAHIILNRAAPISNDTLYKELDRQQINAKFWEPIYDKQSVVRSINLSHKQIVRFAADHNLPEICIMEEDVMFPAADGWAYFQAQKPAKFDLYLAGAYGLNSVELQKVSNGIEPVKIKQFAGLHCYIIDQRYYATFLSMPEDKHIDSQAGKGEFYVCAPFAALQHPGWSSNNQQKVNYNLNIPPECIYGKT